MMQILRLPLYEMPLLSYVISLAECPRPKIRLPPNNMEGVYWVDGAPERKWMDIGIWVETQIR